MMVKPLSCSTLKSSVRGLDVIANHKTLVTAFAKPETGRQKTTCSQKTGKTGADG